MICACCVIMRRVRGVSGSDGFQNCAMVGLSKFSIDGCDVLHNFRVIHLRVPRHIAFTTEIPTLEPRLRDKL